MQFGKRFYLTVAAAWAQTFFLIAATAFYRSWWYADVTAWIRFTLFISYFATIIIFVKAWLAIYREAE